MENNDHESWSSAHIYKSQWLQTTISDLDEKLEAMMTILEDGSNSPNDEHRDYKWREDFMCMLEEFGQSYRALAIAHNQLKCKISDEGEYHEFLSADSCSMKLKPELEGRDTETEEGMTDLSINRNDSMKIGDSEINLEDPSMVEFKCDNKWSAMEFQIAKLTKDNVNQFIELARRNDEKRETIRRLHLEVEDLKRKNRVLLFSSRYSNANLERHEPWISNPGGSNIGKLFRGCSP
ncbi:protein NETWORKED 3A-like isoform X3 [Arachis stenosperma]|uniref:protein NETWORKED 3A-like isoform X3 n=1 Tax=Arachis stenosperma TaxID=217475 RepID=UPI0025AC3CC2|nr:protein NETWORKED 3A-like isoform X3 [Arachis stenosperma]